MKSINTNNFDSCSYMPKVEINLCRDEYLAQENFDSNFQRIKNDLWFFSDYGNLDWKDIGVEELLDFSTVTQGGAKEYLKEKDAYFSDYENIVNFDCVAEAIDYVKREINLEEFLSDKSGFELPESVKLKFARVILRGYCQGDYAEVILLQSTYEDFWPDLGAKEKQYKFKEMFGHLFYDQPIRCEITIDGEEYRLHEEMKDCYEYDKEELLKILADFITKEDEWCDLFGIHRGSTAITAQILDFVTEELPQNL